MLRIALTLCQSQRHRAGRILVSHHHPCPTLCFPMMRGGEPPDARPPHDVGDTVVEVVHALTWQGQRRFLQSPLLHLRRNGRRVMHHGTSRRGGARGPARKRSQRKRCSLQSITRTTNQSKKPAISIESDGEECRFRSRSATRDKSNSAHLGARTDSAALSTHRRPHEPCDRSARDPHDPLLHTARNVFSTEPDKILITKLQTALSRTRGDHGVQITRTSPRAHRRQC